MDDDTDPWDTNVPPDLVPAIAHLRESFDRVHFEFGYTTEVVCFSQLHDGKGKGNSDLREYIDLILQLKKVVGLDASRRFDKLIERGTLPAILKAFLDLYREGLKIQALYIFQELLKIGQANEGRLGLGAIEWAKSQAQILIGHHRPTIKGWVQEVCHEHVCDGSEPVEEQIHWNSWRAPSFLVMKPCLYRPYDPDKVWELCDSETSKKLLDAFADQYVLFLEVAVKDAAGRAALKLAKQPKEKHDTAADHESRRAGGSTGEPRSPRPGGKTKQPRKRESLRRSVIRSAIQAGLTGLKYCKCLDERGLSVPPTWEDDGCPRGYFAAYNKGAKWKQRIYDEKSRHRRKYVQA